MSLWYVCACVCVYVYIYIYIYIYVRSYLPRLNILDICKIFLLKEFLSLLEAVFLVTVISP